jgi:hypothetical protein
MTKSNTPVDNLITAEECQSIVMKQELSKIIKVIRESANNRGMHISITKPNNYAHEIFNILRDHGYIIKKSSITTIPNLYDISWDKSVSSNSLKNYCATPIDLSYSNIVISDLELSIIDQTEESITFSINKGCLIIPRRKLDEIKRSIS